VAQWLRPQKWNHRRRTADDESRAGLNGIYCLVARWPSCANGNDAAAAADDDDDNVSLLYALSRAIVDLL